MKENQDKQGLPLNQDFQTPNKVNTHYTKELDNEEKNTTPHLHSLERKIVIKKGFKRIWTTDEDDLLKDLVKQYGAKDWSNIATNFQNRGGKQCRQRWHNHLREGVRKEDWTIDQEWILALGVKAYGHKWSMISNFLPGRTDNTIKNRWNCKMKPKKCKFQTRIDEIIISEPNCKLSQSENILISLIRENQNVTNWACEDEQKRKMKDNCKTALNDYFKLTRQFDNHTGEGDIIHMMEEND